MRTSTNCRPTSSTTSNCLFLSVVPVLGRRLTVQTIGRSYSNIFTGGTRRMPRPLRSGRKPTLAELSTIIAVLSFLHSDSGRRPTVVVDYRPQSTGPRSQGWRPVNTEQDSSARRGESTDNPRATVPLAVDCSLTLVRSLSEHLWKRCYPHKPPFSIKIVTPSRDLLLTQPTGGPNRHAVRSLSGDSCRSPMASAGP